MSNLKSSLFLVSGLVLTLMCASCGQSQASKSSTNKLTKCKVTGLKGGLSVLNGIEMQFNQGYTDNGHFTEYTISKQSINLQPDRKLYNKSKQDLKLSDNKLLATVENNYSGEKTLNDSKIVFYNNFNKDRQVIKTILSLSTEMDMTKPAAKLGLNFTVSGDFNSPKVLSENLIFTLKPIKSSKPQVNGTVSFGIKDLQLSHDDGLVRASQRLTGRFAHIINRFFKTLMGADATHCNINEKTLKNAFQAMVQGFQHAMPNVSHRESYKIGAQLSADAFVKADFTSIFFNKDFMLHVGNINKGYLITDLRAGINVIPTITLIRNHHSKVSDKKVNEYIKQYIDTLAKCKLKDKGKDKDKGKQCKTAQDNFRNNVAILVSLNSRAKFSHNAVDLLALTYIKSNYKLPKADSLKSLGLANKLVILMVKKGLIINANEDYSVQATIPVTYIPVEDFFNGKIKQDYDFVILTTKINGITLKNYMKKFMATELSFVKTHKLTAYTPQEKCESKGLKWLSSSDDGKGICCHNYQKNAHGEKRCLDGGGYKVPGTPTIAE